MRQVRLHLPDAPKHHVDYWLNRRGNQILCTSSMRRLLRIPEDTKVLYAVFTKSGYKDYKYTLIRQESGSWWRGTTYGVKESRASLVLNAESIIKRAMQDGYKYVHFEVES